MYIKGQLFVENRRCAIWLEGRVNVGMEEDNRKIWDNILKTVK